MSRPGSAAAAPGCTGWPVGPTCGWPRAREAPRVTSACPSASNHRWPPSSRSCSAPGGPPTSASASWPARTGRTTVRIEVVGEAGATSVRTWGHSRWFAAADLVDRLYWQLQADPLPGAGVRGPVRAGVGGVAGRPRRRAVGQRQRPAGGARGGPPAGDARARGGGGARGAGRSRARGNGRLAVPWGERAENRRTRDLPWPGSIPPPAPTRVFAEPRPAAVLGPDGRPVGCRREAAIRRNRPGSGPGSDEELLAIQAWAGPWPIDELWWDPAGARQVARFQIVGRRQRLAAAGGERHLVDRGSL